MKKINQNKSVVTYKISKAQDINSLYISVQNGEVEITAPVNFTNKQIYKVIEEKKEWILKKIEEYNKKRATGISRNPLEILGQEYKIKICYKNIKIPQLDIEKKEIKITLPNKNKKTDNKVILNIAIEKMYESIAKVEVERAMEKARITLGYAPEDYKITKIKNKLAKTTKSVITINPEIVKYDRDIIDEIVLKEFLKLKSKIKSKKVA